MSATAALVEAPALARAIKLTDKVVNEKHYATVLQNVLIKIGDGQIEISASDLEQEMTLRVPAECGGERAQFVAPHRRIDGFLRGLGGDLRATFGGDKLSLSSGRARCVIPTAPATDWFDLPRVA